MTIGSRMITGVCVAVVSSTIVGLLVQRAAIRQQGIETTLATMRAAISQAEGARGTVALLNQRGAFDREKLIAEFRQTRDLRGSTIYSTVPVVAAWRGIETVAKQEGYQFRVPKHQARNPRNLPQPSEVEILRRLEAGEAEYVQIDEKNNRLIYARPIKLTAECLACHGDPAQSPTHDGRDVLGYPMENWKEGEVHGAFVLASDLGKVDALVQAGVFRVLAWMLPLTILVCFGSVWASRRFVIRPLQSAVGRVAMVSQQTAAASGQIASASQQLAEGASQQAATLEETSATLQEAAAGGRRNRQGADSARLAAEEAWHAAQGGVDKTRQLHATIEGIQEASRNVGSIAKTIDEMAFQTNLLAINAAIEAARAGDAGLGFGVVAEEVRALATRSSKAVEDTARQVNSSLSQAGHGVEVSQETLAALEQIAAQSLRSREAIESIATATTEQAASLNQLESNLRRIDKITQSNAANAEENAAASEELAAQARELSATVRDMTALLGV